MGIDEPTDIKRMPTLVELLHHIRTYENPDLFEALVEDFEMILDRWNITMRLAERGKPVVRPRVSRSNMMDEMERGIADAIRQRPKAGEVVSTIAGGADGQQG